MARVTMPDIAGPRPVPGPVHAVPAALASKLVPAGSAGLPSPAVPGRYG